LSPDMRIIAGMWKGRKISSFSSGYRPTAAVVKKSLFDTIGADIEDAGFLDLFAGAGAVGLEALSRGARFVCFVENNDSRVGVLRRNLDTLGARRDSFGVFGVDYLGALQMLRDREAVFDFIYVDPPYKGPAPRRILAEIVASRVLAEGGLLILEADRRNGREVLDSAPEELYPLRERLHGGTALIFFRWRRNESTET